MKLEAQIAYLQRILKALRRENLLLVKENERLRFGLEQSLNRQRTETK